jgi:class 3 adenylate cyclase
MPPDQTPIQRSDKPALEIAHVLFFDIVAYSQQPLDKQRQFLSQLQQIVSSASEFQRAQACQQLISLPTGDGMALVFFGDAEAPARCALEIGRSLRQVPELKLRMGIHTGPVYRVADINAAENVAGNGINMAQRVMDCGDAGHILISSQVAEVLGQISHWRSFLHDLGDAEVKHGVRVHLFNLFTPDAGNAEVPRRLQGSGSAHVNVLAQTKISGERTLRYQHASEIRTDLQRLKRNADSGKSAVGEGATPVRRGKPVTWIAGAALVAVVAALAGLFPFRRTPKLTDKDSIVLADFINTTGDSVFDGTLRRGLSVELEQSPFLSVVPDETIQQTLHFMGKAPDVRLTPEIAREICQRTSSTVELEGSIALIGTKYDVTLRAINCATQERLASAERQSDGKDQVLSVLGSMASEIREKFGESPLTLKKYSTSLIQATTSSLEALQAYNLGWKALVSEENNSAALSFFQQATKLDPDFATAYWGTCMAAGNLGEDLLAEASCQRAYDLRQKLSEPEKLIIEADNEDDVRKAQRTYEFAVRLYPRAPQFRINLASILANEGEFEASLEQWKEALKSSQGSSMAYAGLIDADLALNRIKDAEELARDARAKGLDSSLVPLFYDLAFYGKDSAGMDRQAELGLARAGNEDLILARQADTAAYFGEVQKARQLSRDATDSAFREGRKETAATYKAVCALREALFGNVSEAGIQAAHARSMATGPALDYAIALALAYAGNARMPKELADDLARRFPENTAVQSNYLPTLRAKLSLNSADFQDAINRLRTASPYEMGSPSEAYFWQTLYPVYVRGEAYLAAHGGNRAAEEFQKILDHRGIVLYEPIGALANLQLGRAYLMAGETAKAKAAYKDFLTLWKDADPDIPILKQAKAEYAKLQ